ncbi:tripartite tricarboxylate transporter permease [Actinacidiphila guanduensis]|uniref:Putative tricarboxylic transport membrane protein n=1 Tax=Actinacidiphila guanduensis TaxID=310781 RepID=A0A1G9VG03_9ACTN|nr:tripartite tricarboxylate transporter permease [Actinacidiphila guanduensis]SDM71013.1 putative tricarboxylic transport membrane protein [Actinacidiphila guanduensis]
MFHGLISGFSGLFAPYALLMLLVGTLVGTLVGAIPGLGGAVLLTLLLPFVYGMPIVPALALLLAAHTGIYFSGSVTAILFNTPGAPESAATTFDGYAMTRAGQPARALGISAAATTVGGWIGVALLFVLIPFMSKLATLFHASEYLALAVLAIVLIGQMRAASVTKGLLSGAIGLMTSFVGYDPITGVQRFTSGYQPLYSGFNITAAALGLFALSEMFRIYAAGRDPVAAEAAARTRGAKDPGNRVLTGVRDLRHHPWLTVRSAVLGTVLGIIPGIGGIAANFISYGQAMKTSKHPERFGTGTPEGIIAPEASSISKEAGNLLPTVALGVPGGVGMAVLLSGFTILGIVPGPAMLKDHVNAVWAMALVIGVGSLLASLTGLGLAPLLARLAKVPGRTLVPFVVALGFLGVFAAADELAQVTVMVAFGVVGYLMTRFGYSLPAAMIGFILGKVVENNLYLVSQLQGWGALKRPLTDVMVAITVLSLFGPLFKRAFRLLVPRRDPLPPALRTAGAAGGQGDPDAAAAPGRTDGPAAPEGEPAGPSGTPAGESPVTTPSGGAGESGENR